MPLKYNYGQADPTEYNRPNGDSFNGKIGSMQPAAVQNQAASGGGKAGDAYSMFKASSSEWYAPPTAKPAPTPAAQSPARTGSYARPAIDPTRLTGILSTPTNDLTRGATPMPKPAAVPTAQNRDRTGRIDPTGLSNILTGKITPGGTLEEMRYGRPLGTPGIPAGGGKNRINDPGPGGGGGGTQQPPPNNNGPIVRPPGTDPDPGEFDPYGVRRDLDPANGPPKPTNTEDPEVAAQWYSYWIPGITGADVARFRIWAMQPGNENVHITDWWRQGKPQYEAPPPPPPPAPPPPGPPGTNTPPTPRTTDPTIPAPPGLPPASANPPKPNTPGPPDRTDPSQWNEVFMPNTPDTDEITRLLQKMLDPTFTEAQNDLANVLRGQAALTGDSNAMGFNEIMGREVGSLVNTQQAQVADKAFEFDQAARDRALEQYQTDSQRSTDRYQIDSQKFIDLLNDDTQRYQIRTNSDLEMYLADQATNFANRKLDVETLRGYYEAELNLRGIQYSANSAFDQAALNAATERYIADLNDNYNWGQLGMQQYGIDRDAQIRLIGILQQSGISPAMIQAIIGGMVPGYSYTPGG